MVKWLISNILIFTLLNRLTYAQSEFALTGDKLIKVYNSPNLEASNFEVKEYSIMRIVKHRKDHFKVILPDGERAFLPVNSNIFIFKEPDKPVKIDTIRKPPRVLIPFIPKTPVTGTNPWKRDGQPYLKELLEYTIESRENENKLLNYLPKQ